MYIQGTPEFEHHVKTYGPHKDFGYKDFVPMFRAEKFQPEEWIRLFKKAGARYVVPVAEHHDGFQMYKSEISHWNAFEMGPKRWQSVTNMTHLCSGRQHMRQNIQDADMEKENFFCGCVFFCFSE